MKLILMAVLLTLWIPSVTIADEEVVMDEPKQEEIVVGPEEPTDVVIPADVVPEEEAAPVPDVPLNPEAHTPVP